MSTLFNVRLSKITTFIPFKIIIVTHIMIRNIFCLCFDLQWFVKNYNSNIHYFTFTWTLVLPPMNKVFDILLVLKMITTLNNKDWWYLVVLKWKVKKNQSITVYPHIHSYSQFHFTDFGILPFIIPLGILFP